MFFCRISNLWILLIVVSSINRVNCVNITSPINERRANSNVDMVIFVQNWPISECVRWMNDRTSNTCRLPPQRDMWTIHGIWPTKLGTKGPRYCNRTAELNVDSLEPVLGKLKQFWMTLHEGHTDASFWSYEWLKHGTCGSDLAGLDTESKYFGQALEWIQRYAITDLLNRANIQPHKEYSITELHNGIRSTLNHNPSIHCIRDKYTGDIYLSEIRLCFNKQLELIDCVGVRSNYNSTSGIITNCESTESIIYPGAVPQHLFSAIDIGMAKTVRRFPWIIQLYTKVLASIRIILSFTNWIGALSQDLNGFYRFISSHFDVVQTPMVSNFAEDSK